MHLYAPMKILKQTGPSLFALSLLFSAASVFSSANATECASFFLSSEQGSVREIVKRPLEKLQELKFMSYNMENLFLSGDPGKGVKSPVKLMAQAKVFRDVNPDVAVVVEVESLETLQKFVREYLNDEYTAFLTPGNDGRGINIGFLVKKDLPFQFELTSNRKEQWDDPADDPSGNHNLTPLFSRDLPILSVWSNKQSKTSTPIARFIGVHFKAKIDRDGDPQAALKRSAEMASARKIFQQYMKKDGPNAAIILAGDFNASFASDPETAQIKDPLLRDALDIMNVPMDQRVSHLFFSGPQNPIVADQLDYILMTPTLQRVVQEAKVYRYRDGAGNELPLPRTSKQRKKQPSDHNPIWMRFLFQPIFQQASPLGM